MSQLKLDLRWEPRDPRQDDDARRLSQLSPVCRTSTRSAKAGCRRRKHRRKPFAGDLEGPARMHALEAALHPLQS